jgi:hypothetical protein
MGAGGAGIEGGGGAALVTLTEKLVFVAAE